MGCQSPAPSNQARPALAGARCAREGLRGGRDGRGRGGTWPHLQGSSQPCLTAACPWVTSRAWFSLETRCLPKLLGSLGYGASICLVVLPHHPSPFSRSGISESSGSQITREGEQTPPSPAHQDLSDPLPFLHSPSCSSASLPSALPVLPDNSQPSSLASRYF